LCTGILHETKGHYGWILPSDKIDHPEARKHRGGIYLDTRDIRPGTPLVKGDEVAFYLYADAHGIGAEDCHLKCAALEKPEPALLAWTTLRPKAPPQRGGQTLSIADLLDNADGDEKKKLTGKDPKIEDPNINDSADARCCDLENDPILRILLQPRTKEAKLDEISDSESTSAGTCSSQSSPSTDVVEPQILEGPTADAPEEADLFETLRAELREARARAGLLAPRDLKPVQPEPINGLLVLPGFTPPPGLPAPGGLLSPVVSFGPPPGL
jgi:hypothetical protein